MKCHNRYIIVNSSLKTHGQSHKNFLTLGKLIEIFYHCECEYNDLSLFSIHKINEEAKLLMNETEGHVMKTS